MKISIRLFVLLFLISISCNYRVNSRKDLTNDTVLIRVFTIDNHVKWKGKRIFKKFDTKDKIVFHYIDTMVSKNNITNEPYRNIITVLKNNDSIILDGNNTCYYSGSKNYLVDKTIYRIKKYVYDDKKARDEESELFINDSVGIVQIYSLAWSNYVVYEKDSLSRILNKCLLEDSTIFVRSEKNRKEYYQNLKRYLK